MRASRAPYAWRMQTSMRVTAENRDALARIAATELGGVSLDEALRVVLFEHLSRAALARLTEHEQLLYADLCADVFGPSVRLEQERIGYHLIHEALEASRDHG